MKTYITVLEFYTLGDESPEDYLAYLGRLKDSDGDRLEYLTKFLGVPILISDDLLTKDD